MTPEEYERRRQAKLDRFNELADKNRRESAQRFKAFEDNLHMIPMGQPILVGHHSEAGHRAHLKRIDNHMRKSIEADEKAKYYAGRAAAIESNRAIFSDDPNAAEKLADRIARLEKMQEKMREANKLVRKQNREGLLDMGFTEDQVTKLLTNEPGYGMGFPHYKFTNNSGNIRRLKQRLARTEAHANDKTTEKEIEGTRIVENVEENRVQIHFPAKPPEKVLDALKANGWRWSRFAGAWQRHRSSWASHLAEDFAKMYAESTKPAP